MRETSCTVSIRIKQAAGHASLATREFLSMTNKRVFIQSASNTSVIECDLEERRSNERSVLSACHSASTTLRVLVSLVARQAAGEFCRCSQSAEIIGVAA